MPPPTRRDDDEVFAPADGVTCLDEIWLEGLRMRKAPMQNWIESQVSKTKLAPSDPCGRLSGRAPAALSGHGVGLR